MKSLSLSPQDPNFLRIILAELEEIKKILGIYASTDQSVGKLLQPKEVCQKYGISRNTLEKFFNTDLLTPLRLSPESRKIYVAESQLNQIFKSQINRNR